MSLITPSRMTVSLALSLMCSALLSGCATLHMPADAADHDAKARVSGDYRLRAGAPVNVYLRSVDGVALKFWEHAADMPSGEHRLLVDCQVTAADKLSRHELVVTLEPGARYRLTAEATPTAGCTAVTLQQVEE